MKKRDRENRAKKRNIYVRIGDRSRASSIFPKLLEIGKGKKEF